MTLRTLSCHFVSCFALLSANLHAAPKVEPAQQITLPALGPLFFTPAERDELDRIRVGIAGNVDPAHLKRTMELNGIIQKNGGPPVVWINGERYKGRQVAGASLDNRALDNSTIIVHMPPPDPRDMALKVGQTLDPAGGNLREVYQRPPQELNQLLQLLAKRGAEPEKKDSKNLLNKANSTTTDLIKRTP